MFKNNIEKKEKKEEELKKNNFHNIFNENYENNNEKKINIKGTTNRYLMKKVMKQDLVIEKKRKYNYSYLLEKEEYSKILQYEYQFFILNYIIENFHVVEDDSQLIISTKDKENIEHDIQKISKKIILQEINKKINNYKQQDLKKNIYNINYFITTIQVVQKLNEIHLKCFYCNSELFIVYDIVRETNQWTLDRIDNNIGHTNDNTIVSCLKCNLKRRNINKVKFENSCKITFIKSCDKNNDNDNNNNNNNNDNNNDNINDNI